MDESYVIGIRLALENGVSAGIAAIASDLQNLDGAIAQTTSHLHLLQQAAASASSAVAADLQRLARDGEPRLKPPPAGTAELPPADPVPSVRVPSAPPFFATPSAAPARAVPNQPAPETTVPVAPPPASVPIVRIVPPTAPPLAPAAPFVLPQAAPPPPRGKDAPAFAAFAPFVPGSPPHSRQASATPAPELSADERRQVAGPAFQRPGTPSPPAFAAPPPRETVATPSAAAPAAAIAPRATNASAAPPPRAAASAPTQGDVYLDGARLGRWLSDRLAREATRPAAGSTAFDPRLGLAWPGALHGP